MYFLHAISVWFRRTFSWVLNPASWREIGVAIALIAVGFCLWWFRQSIPALGQVILWGLWLLSVAILLRQGWLKLFGPVLFYDLIRSGRRGRHIAMRVLYACLLFFLLFCTWWSMHPWLFGGYYDYRGGMTPQQASQMTQSYFENFMAVQLIAVLILTPAYLAGAIADEKNRRTLEFLLATDLRSREFVLSKLGARLGQLSLFVMTGLPILSILQFMGGVSPDIIIAGFIATAATMLGLAGISIFHSTYYKRPFNAIAISYLTLVAYLIISFLLWWLQIGVFGWNPMTGTTSIGPSLVPYFLEGSGLELIWLGFLEVVDKVIEIFNSGNLPMILIKKTIFDNMSRWGGGVGTPALMTWLWPYVRGYAGFHLLLAVVCISWSMFRLRPVALKQASQPQRERMRQGLLGMLGFGRPRIYGLPMVWKELHVEGGLRFNWIGWAIVLLIVVTSFIPVLVILYYFVEYLDRGNYGFGGYNWSPWDNLAQSMNVYIRFMTVIVGTILLLAVAIRASWSISGERDRQSMDSLLTTPLSSTQILAAKWLGAIASVRFGWLWLGTAFFLGLITMGLHPIALPLVIGEWFVFAAFVSILGCWFSLFCKTSLRATIWTLVWTGILGVGHWLVWMCCGVFFVIASGPGGMGGGREVEYITKFQGGLTPPVAMAYSAFSYVDFRHDFQAEHVGEMIVFSIIGTGFWLFATTCLWVVASARFRSMTRRESDLLPEFQRLPEVRPPPVPPLPLAAPHGVPEERIKPVQENVTAEPPPFYEGMIEILGEDPKPPPLPDSSADVDKNEP